MPSADALKVVGKPGGTERPTGCDVKAGGVITTSTAVALAEPD